VKTFTEYTDEERAEWRENEVTQAFLVWLHMEAEKARDNAVMAVRSAPAPDMGYGSATKYVGEMAAFDKAFDTANRETFK